MSQYFKPEFFQNNRANFKKQVRGLSVIGANQLLLKSSDESYEFIQDPNFWYLTGIDYPGIILVIYEKNEFLILPKTNKDIDLFDGALDKNELKQIFGSSNIYDYSFGINKLKELILKNKQINTLKPLRRSRLELNIYPNPNRDLIIKKIKYFKKDILINDLSEVFKNLRAIKAKEEIEAIEKAVKTTIYGINKVEKLINLNKLKTAHEVASELEYIFRKQGAKGHAFTPIVANSKDATTIHYRDLSPKLIKDNLIVIDVGANFNNYKADITRTIFFGKISKRQREVFEAVKKVQNKAIKYIKPGITFLDLHKYVEGLIQKELFELGLIDKNDSKSVSRYFPHAFGHSLGLETHDLVDYKSSLKENMVITMEPGIYIKEENIAVRIEDDILVTKNGSKILGT